MRDAEIRQLRDLIGQSVRIHGWLYNSRSSGKLRFLVVRDGSGYLQSVVFKPGVEERVWDEAGRATQESSLWVTGRVKEDPRSPGGVELEVADLGIVSLCPEYPITPKEHGPDFLLNNRHLWLRSKRQHAIMRVRNELVFGIRDFFYQRNYVNIDSPILTPAACEGTSTLFETDYFGEKAFLSQSGQLYLEPAAAAHGKVYCFGPTFRAEKSKTRRHLMEFWMVEPEVAWMRFPELLDLAEEFVSSLVARVLDRCKHELEWLERDVSKLEPAASRPYPRIDYGDAITKLQGLGYEAKFGDDFGGDEETALSDDSGKPTMITRYPAAIKAFYMEPDADDPARALAVDVIAPEGYGEIIGGSERIGSYDLLEQRIREHNLPREAFEWYLDVRRYGGFPHSGFGMGIERVVSWMCGLQHLREAIPYPRMLNRLYP
ncbi:MAG: asparagine--tRNA ligase [Thermoanaerobaculaceae bacterium]|jgi:asparaginyl-tRNA synthetase|nr:asparagine--tRNA ligase [Thermoanaerobaculaceae bacterium]